MIFAPNFDGLEEKCLLVPETLTNNNVNDSSIPYYLDLWPGRLFLSRDF